MQQIIIRLNAYNERLREKLSELYIQMYLVSLDMEELGDDETKEHAKELLGASKICKEWSEHAKVKK